MAPVKAIVWNAEIRSKLPGRPPGERAANTSSPTSARFTAPPVFAPVRESPNRASFKSEEDNVDVKPTDKTCGFRISCPGYPVGQAGRAASSEVSIS